MDSENDNDNETGRKKHHFKSNMFSMKNIIDELITSGFSFNEEQHRLIDNSPFNELVNSFINGDVMESYCKKSDTSVLQIISCYDASSKGFRFGQTLVRLTARDVNDIFGLTAKGMKIQVSKRHAPLPSEHFIQRNFNPGTPVTRSLIISQLHRRMKLKHDSDNEDVVRLICMLVCTTLLFTNNQYSISWNLVSLFEQFRKIKDFNWGQAVIDFLISSIEKHPMRPDSVIGCTPLLLYWFAKISSSIPISPARESLHPFFLKVDLKKICAFIVANGVHHTQINSVRKVKSGKGKIALPDYFPYTIDDKAEHNIGSPIHLDVLCTEQNHRRKVIFTVSDSSSDEVGPSQGHLIEGRVMQSNNAVCISASGSSSESEEPLSGMQLMLVGKTGLTNVPGSSDFIGSKLEYDIPSATSPRKEGEYLIYNSPNPQSQDDPLTINRDMVNPSFYTPVKHVHSPYSKETHPSSSTPVVMPKKLFSTPPEDNDIIDEYEEVPCTPEVVRQLRFDNETLNCKYLRCQSSLKMKCDDVSHYRGKLQSSETSFRSVSIDLDRVKEELNEMNEKCAGLTAELSAMRRLKDSIYNECLRLRSEIKCQKMYRKNLEAELCNLSVIQSDMPSFNIVSEDMLAGLEDGPTLNQFNELKEMYERSIKRVTMLENLKKNQEHRVSVLNETIKTMKAEKAKESSDFQKTISNLQNVIDIKSKEIHGVRGALMRVTENLKQRSTELSGERQRIADNEAQIVRLQNFNSEYSIEISLLKERLGKYEHIIQKNRPEPSSLVKAVKGRKTRKQVQKPEYDYAKGINQKRTMSMGNSENDNQEPKMKKAVTFACAPSLNRCLTISDLATNPVFNQLDKDSENKLIGYIGDDNNRSVIWKGRQIAITMKDIESVLLCFSTPSDIVDAFTYQIHFDKTRPASIGKNTVVLTTKAARSAIEGNKLGVQIWIQEPIMGRLNNFSQILVPIFHAEKGRYSLLHVDIASNKAYHMDPMRGKDADEQNDVAYDQAVIVHTEITGFLRLLKEISPHLIRSRTITLLDTNADGIANINISLHDFQVKALESLQSQNIECPMNICYRCPQASDNLADTGIFIMKYMQDVRRGSLHGALFSEAEVVKMRASVVSSILMAKYYSL